MIVKISNLNNKINQEKEIPMKKRAADKNNEQRLPDNETEFLMKAYHKKPIEYIRKSIKQLLITKCPKQRFTILSNVTEAKTILGNYEGAIKTSLRTSSMATSMHDEILYGKSLLSRAISFLWFGKIERASEIIQKCFQIGDKNNSTTLKCKCLLLMARIDLLNNYPERCELNMRRATYLAQTIGNSDLITAGTLIKCELLISSGHRKEAIKTAQLCLSESDDRRGPLQDEIKTLLGGLYLSENEIIKALDSLSLQRHFSGHSMGWGLNAGLRLASVHLKANQINDALVILSNVKFKTLPAHEQCLFLKIKMKAARTGLDYKKFKELQIENVAFERKTEKGVIHYGNMQADILNVKEAPVYAEIIGNNGRRILSKQDSQSLQPEKYIFFYNSLTGNIYHKGALLETLSPKSIKGALLSMLMENNGRFYNHKQIYETIWKSRFNPEFNDNNVYVTISKLRKILKDTKTLTDWQFLKSSDQGAYTFEPAKNIPWAIVIPVRE
jgi:hypothetical protein